MSKEAYMQSVIDMMETYQQAFAEETILLVMDLEKVVGFSPTPSIKVKIPVGTPRSALANSVSDQALSSGKVCYEERGPEAFGIAYVATATPLRYNGELIGVLSSVTVNEKFEMIRNSSESLAASVEEMTATSNHLASGFSSIHGEMDQLSAKSASILQDITAIQSIIEVVQELADTSNLLGLNASIEAAHAGQYGRGFAVVADEIRKMANQSKDASKTIRTQLNEMQSRLNEINSYVETVKQDMAHHAESVRELDSAFEHIAVTANELMDRFGAGKRS
ncbi:methyl-accepting chemotaxis protein (MCP) signaling protein [Paenibacillus taihuensis]|uniref:Methyl-accepting chemotaxis protein (MCP) signaling protein n=1 Tax=Paenibacillus taihuensis TaxID=1156355 RepID=A0A3D9PY88_9BACL|nr:methyl-accepting chemotaxis protein [Paenibacillus taihuensis]REE54736.1 methyl-accepting chemotaxis protein (MCP) signaling protein [Paenibacillus taihuensis]